MIPNRHFIPDRVFQSGMKNGMNLIRNEFQLNSDSCNPPPLPPQVMDSKSTVFPHLHLVYAENSTLPGFGMKIYEICSATRGFSSQPRVVTVHVCIRPENLIPEHYRKKVEHLQSSRGVSSGQVMF